MRRRFLAEIAPGGTWPENPGTAAGAGTPAVDPYSWIRWENRGLADVVMSIDGAIEAPGGTPNPRQYWDYIPAGECNVRNIGKPSATELHLRNVDASATALVWIELDTEPIVDLGNTRILLDRSRKGISPTNPLGSNISAIGGVAVPAAPAGQQLNQPFIPAVLIAGQGYPVGQQGSGLGDDSQDNLGSLINSWPMISTARQKLWNGAGWDLARNNVSLGTLLASAVRTASATTPNQNNFNGRGAIISVTVTAISGTGATLTPIVQGQDYVTAAFNSFFSFAGITAVGTYWYVLYPGAASAPAAGAAAQLPLPRVWNVLFQLTGTTPSCTYSVGAGSQT